MFVSNVSLERRRADLTLDEFRSHWLDPHGPMTAKLPGTRFYVQNHVVYTRGTNSLANKLNVDGFAQLAYDNVKARTAAYDSPELAACNLDSPLFLAGVSRLVTESEGVPPPEEEHLVKAFALVSRQNGATAEVPSAASVLKLLPRACRHTVHTIIEQSGPPHSKVPFIGIEVDLLMEVWFKSEADLVACAENKQLEANNIALFHVRTYQFV